MNKPTVSKQWLHDPSYFRFDRTSGLPLSYFEPRINPDRIIVGVSVGVFVLTVLGLATGLL